MPGKYDVIIIGAGAAGLMAAIRSGQKGKRVLVVEHTNKIGEKIRISGGGRCNFTNLYTSNHNFISQNPHFVKSALSQYTQHDFINLVESYKIAYHEKTLGQLFCDGSSSQIINMFIDLCTKYQVDIRLSCNVKDVFKNDYFKIESDQGDFIGDTLVIATGGLSIPKIGASDFGYRVAKKFGLNIVSTKPALVPLIVPDEQKKLFNELRGISNHSIVTYKDTSFTENILFTHKGLSGPAILQISSYLNKFDDEKISINLLPNLNLENMFAADKNNKQTLANYLKVYLTNRLVDNFSLGNSDFNKTITDLTKEKLSYIAKFIHNFQVPISDSEGYLKAEVTSGGVDTRELSSKTMESIKVPGLFFVGEVVDVTGWLGGYNFQWAWSSGFVAANSFK
ncbi:NAD(P)/FAD-dependent oxidoreductase [Candidatus Megaera venefica]|uniref:NAD(P)/FAD-dependent oxidoreductase n=1 Tax=Candidatus Megaera venefica TaxID=2055910 RepID=A0ABU5NBD7_9RICK|nr:aminoacetone oxidase family FAD-binding enzyme [Candidatus Megaera venefica]MEA0970494.1 NAD(P)/FAD-dependent oxidoreductase [Candidatus Megaera venefica]